MRIIHAAHIECEISHFTQAQCITNQSHRSRVHNEIKPEDIIFPSGVHEQLFVAPAGPIPPNPAELLERARLKEAFAYFREQLCDYFDRIYENMERLKNAAMEGQNETV